MSFGVCIKLCLASHSRSIVLRHPLLALLLIELKLPRTVALSYQFCYTPYRIVSSPPRIIYLSSCARFVCSSPHSCRTLSAPYRAVPPHLSRVSNSDSPTTSIALYSRPTDSALKSLVCCGVGITLSPSCLLSAAAFFAQILLKFIKQ